MYHDVLCDSMLLICYSFMLLSCKLVTVVKPAVFSHLHYNSEYAN